MGHLWGIQPFGGAWLGAMWVVWALWMALTWGAFARRGTVLGNQLSLVEDWTRYLLIPALILVSASSLLGFGPFEAGIGQKWYSAKLLVFGLLLIIGVTLRLIMHEWRAMFPVLAQGPDTEVEARLKRSIRLGRSVAYLYWSGIILTAFFGAVKPF
jgi:hypothetical protein